MFLQKLFATYTFYIHIYRNSTLIYRSIAPFPVIQCYFIVQSCADENDHESMRKFYNHFILPNTTEGHKLPLTEEEFDKMKAKKEKAARPPPPSLRFFERKKAEKEQLRKVG